MIDQEVLNKISEAAQESFNKHKHYMFSGVMDKFELTEEEINELVYLKLGFREGAKWMYNNYNNLK